MANLGEIQFPAHTLALPDSIMGPLYLRQAGLVLVSLVSLVRGTTLHSAGEGDVGPIGQAIDPQIRQESKNGRLFIARDAQSHMTKSSSDARESKLCKDYWENYSTIVACDSAIIPTWLYVKIIRVVLSIFFSSFLVPIFQIVR